MSEETVEYKAGEVAAKTEQLKEDVTEIEEKVERLEEENEFASEMRRYTDERIFELVGRMDSFNLELERVKGGIEYINSILEEKGKDDAVENLINENEIVAINSDDNSEGETIIENIEGLVNTDKKVKIWGII